MITSPSARVGWPWTLPTKLPLSRSCHWSRVVTSKEVTERAEDDRGAVKAFTLEAPKRATTTLIEYFMFLDLGRIFYPGKRVYQYVQRSSQPFGLERIKDLRNSSYVKIKIDQGTPENQ